MSDPAAIEFLVFVALVFAVAAALTGTTNHRLPVEERARIWLTFRLEALIIALILGPAYAGALPFGITIAVLAAWAMVEVHRVAGPHGRLRAVLIAGLYPGLGAGALVAIGAGPNRFGHLALLYTLVEINDSGAYLVGKLFGRRRPFPVLSPKKTVAGCVAGFACAVVAALALGFTVPTAGWVERSIVGAAAGVLGQAGDLTASAIKRWAGVKDFGSVVPNHGGVLDVYDSLFFVAPFCYAWLWATARMA